MKTENAPRWLKITSLVVAMLAGLGALGVSMPWDAASKSELRELEKSSGIERNKIENRLSRMEGKIDLILQELR